MSRHLKRGMDASAIKAADAKVRETVETNPRRYRRAQGPGRARAVAKVRQLVAGLVQADAGGSRARHRPGAQARPRRHQIRPGPGAQFRQSAERHAARSRSRDAARRGARPPAYPGQFDRLLRAGRALSDGGVGAYVDRHRARRRRRNTSSPARRRFRAGRIRRSWRRCISAAPTRFSCSAACRRSPPWRSAPRPSRRST